ncbi:MAG: hypothetical protein WKF30_19035 [Pyrinomonadaceae bacterium]
MLRSPFRDVDAAALGGVALQLSDEIEIPGGQIFDLKKAVLCGSDVPQRDAVFVSYGEADFGG